MTNQAIQQVRDRLMLTPEEIGDNLDLDIEGDYPCSDGSTTSTVSVDKLLQAAVDKILSDPSILVKDSDQSKPVIHETGNYIKDLEALHKEYELENWVKLLPKEEV